MFFLKMIKRFEPAYPWRDHPGKEWILLNNGYIPIVHVSDMTGLSITNLLLKCGELGLKIYEWPEICTKRPSPSHENYLSIESLPPILRTLEGWKEEDIEEGMRNFEGLKASKPPKQSKPSKTKRHSKKKVEENQVEIVVVEQEEEEEPPQPPSPPLERPSHKRNRVDELLSRMDEQTRRFEQFMDVMGDDGMKEYVKTEWWREKKQKALQDAVVQEFPAIRESIKQELRAKYESKFQAKVDESEMFRNRVQVAERPASDIPGNSTWVQAFFQAEKTE